MQILWETLSFAAKAGIVFATFSACVFVVVLAMRGRKQGKVDGRLTVHSLNERFERAAQVLRDAALSPKERRAEHKRLAAEEKARRPRDARTFVLDFRGDVMASAVEALREEITAVLAVATKDDRVLLRLESPGGAAHSYGLAAAQLARLRERAIPLTVCVDRVAASGGYMMACVADEIVAAPFAVVGSIGVAAPLPNAHRLLDRYGVDYETATAGRYKRTVTFLGANTEEGRQKFQEQLEETHAIFKDFVKRHRPSLDVDAVATGEHWHGQRGVELGLVDRLATSDDVLVALAPKTELLEVRYHKERSFRERMISGAAEVVERGILTAWRRLDTPMA